MVSRNVGITSLHGVTTQKKEIWIFIAVKTLSSRIGKVDFFNDTSPIIGCHRDSYGDRWSHVLPEVYDRVLEDTQHVHLFSYQVLAISYNKIYTQNRLLKAPRILDKHYRFIRLDIPVTLYA
jgi:hypothetical protein